MTKVYLVWERRLYEFDEDAYLRSIHTTKTSAQKFRRQFRAEPRQSGLAHFTIVYAIEEREIEVAP